MSDFARVNASRLLRDAGAAPRPTIARRHGRGYRNTAVAALLLLLASACSRGADPVTVLEPTDVVTGWYDAGIVEGNKNKLVPSITLRLRNKSDEALRSVQINAIFKRLNETEMWGEHFGWAVQRDALPPGGVTADLVLRSGLGYTGEQPRLQMLQNKE